MKKLILALFTVVSLSAGPLEVIHEQLSNIESGLSRLQAEVDAGFDAQRFQLKRLELDRDILIVLMQHFGDMVDKLSQKTKSEKKVDKLLSQKIDCFLLNMKEACVRECFEQKFERKREIDKEISERLQPLMERHKRTSVRMTASELKVQLEREKQELEEQVTAILERAMDAKKAKNFKCIGA